MLTRTDLCIVYTEKKRLVMVIMVMITTRKLTSIMQIATDIRFQVDEYIIIQFSITYFETKQFFTGVSNNIVIVMCKIFMNFNTYVAIYRT